MDFKIIWSEEAIAELSQICSYIARHDTDAALRMGFGILDHTQILASFLFIGPTYPRAACKEPSGKLFSAHIGFSTTSASNRAASRFFTSGMALAKSLFSELVPCRGRSSIINKVPFSI